MKSLALTTAVVLSLAAGPAPLDDAPIGCGSSSNGLTIGPIPVAGDFVDSPVYTQEEWDEQAEENLEQALLESSYNPGCEDCDGTGCEASATWRGAFGTPLNAPGGGLTGGLILDSGSPFTIECSICYGSNPNPN